MNEVKEHKPTKLIVGMFTNSEGLFQEALRVLEKRSGPIDYESPFLPFDKTDYYEEEFGKDLKRKFYSFQKLIKAEDLPKIKIFTNSLEKKFSKKGNRLINLDPGYLTPAKLVLATTKDYQHRIYYGKGIYGEVTLVFEHGEFRSLPWTYPDYSSETYRDILKQIRQEFRNQLR